MSVIGLAGRYPKSARKVISIIALLALLVALLPAVPAMAAPVTNVNATADNNKAGKPGVKYDVSFTAPSGLGGGDEITVTFATGYAVDQNASVTIVYQQDSYTPAYVNVLGTPGTTVKIGVPAGLSVGANGAVKVSISGVTNPTVAKSYPIAVRTTNDTAGTTTFTIVANVANKIALDAPSSAVANQVVPLKVTIQDKYGNPTTMDSDLTVSFTLTEGTEGTTDNSATLYSDSAATKALTDNKLVISAGNTSGTAYLKDTEAESVTISVGNEGNVLANPTESRITFEASGELAKIAFTAAPAQITAGEAGNFTLQLQDAYGNPVAAGTDGVAVTLTASGANADTVTWGGTGVTADPNDNLKATGTISSGSSDLTFTFSNTKASDKVTITASIEGSALTTSAVFKIVPGAIHHFAVTVADAYAATPDVVEINSDQRTAVTIEARDQHENPVPQANDLTVNLTPDSTTDNGKFYATATSDTAITTATIPADASSVTVYYYDKLRTEDGVQKNITISASASDGTVTGSATVTLMGPRPEKFDIAGDDSIEVNLRLPLTIKLLDQYGNPYAVAQDTTVNLTDNKSGEFYTSLVGGTSVESVTIAAGESEATVYYRPTSAGAMTVTATANVAVNETTTFSVQGTKSVTVRPAGQVANALAISAEPITAGTRGPVTVKVTDQYGNPVAQSADLEVTLLADSPTGKFYDQAQGGNEITAVIIPQGESEATVYYYDTTAGAQTVNASAPGLDPAEITVNVVPADPAKIAVEAEGPVVVNQRVKVTFTVVDQFGNPVIVDGSTLSLVLSSSSATGRFEDESGQITQVTIAAGQSSATAYYKDGTAGEVTITAKTTGLEGSAKLTVQAVPAPDTTPPSEVSNLTVSPSSGAGVFGLSFTAPTDRDLAGVAVYATVYGSNDWNRVEFENEAVYTCEPGETARITVQAPGNLVLGSDRVQFKVVAVDNSGNTSQGVVADNDGQGYPVLAYKELVPGPEGWTTFSVPVQLAGGQKLLGDVIDLSKVNIAWKYDAASQQWVQVTEENNILQPLEAVYVNLKSPALAAIRPDVAPTNPPVKNLSEGWNLVGFTKGDSIDNALYSVRARWSVAVSPAVNPNPWAVTPGGDGGVETHYGYWVYMDAPGKLAGFSTTPLTVGTYPN
ncbi:hypothetical protein [Neomoorella thermoacetica]|uniref:hypothetical protein n=1 Tax=Neomoorella thermoacetica TaxID=1525 RepID=UPI0009155AC1|nr:hypothetical protein [Moorella thermoacetica]OIQ10699.1 hypothetical protein MOOTH_23380 [Moorella thermoacetica]